MKTNSSLSWKTLCIVGSLTLFAIFVRSDQPNDPDFLAQVRGFEKLTDKERETCLDENAQHLLGLKETLLINLHSENEDVRLYAAFFLGVYRFPEAAASLASVITMEDKLRPNMQRRELWSWGSYPCEEALMRIGSPAIPPLIQNLRESDDAKVRKLSLDVLYYIDGDKDIVQLRLQKALKSERDPQKQARIRAALKSLFENRSQ